MVARIRISRALQALSFLEALTDVLRAGVVPLPNPPFLCAQKHTTRCPLVRSEHLVGSALCFVTLGVLRTPRASPLWWHSNTDFIFGSTGRVCVLSAKCHLRGEIYSAVPKWRLQNGCLRPISAKNHPAPGVALAALLKTCSRFLPKLRRFSGEVTD